MTNLQEFEKLNPELARNWDDSAAGWQKWWRIFERAAQMVSDKLVELSGVQAGGRVLDIATGIGEPAVTAARKVGPHGSVLAIDQSAQMLTGARARAAQLGLKNIEFRQADAQSLSLAERGFNAILCRWGLMFIPDVTGALRQMRSLLADDGRLAAAVWSTPDKVPMISLAGDTARKIANLPPPPKGSPDPCRLANRAALEQAFRAAGFSDFRLEPMTITYEFSEPGEFTQFRYEIAAPFRKMIDGLDAATRKRALDAVTEEVRRVTGGGVVRLQNETWCVVGRK